MSNDIFNFLTGGIFTTLNELIKSVIEWVVILITNMSFFLFSPIINKIYSLIPIIEDFSSNLQIIFNFVKPYIAFILDISFISNPILSYLILSILFRVSFKLAIYISKVIVKWYHSIAP